MTFRASPNSASLPRCNRRTQSAICFSHRLGLEWIGCGVPMPGNSLIKSGAIICGGSDAPVERGEPMIEFYAAVARKSIKGESG